MTGKTKNGILTVSLDEQQKNTAMQNKNLVTYVDRPFVLPVTASVVIELQGTPVAKGRPRFGRGRVWTPQKTRNFETDLKWQAKLAMHGRKPIEGPVKVDMLALFEIPKSWPARKKTDALNGVVRPTGKPDIDNLLKTAADALNGIVWVDDAQIVIASISKRYSDKAMLRIMVEAV